MTELAGYPGQEQCSFDKGKNRRGGLRHRVFWPAVGPQAGRDERFPLVKAPRRDDAQARADAWRLERGRRDRAPWVVRFRAGSLGHVEEPADPGGCAGRSLQRFAEGAGDHLTRRLKRGLGEFFHAAREVVVQRPVGHAAFRQQLRPPGGGVALVSQQPRHSLHQFGAGVTVACHLLTLLERMV